MVSLEVATDQIYRLRLRRAESLGGAKPSFIAAEPPQLLPFWLVKGLKTGLRPANRCHKSLPIMKLRPLVFVL